MPLFVVGLTVTMGGGRVRLFVQGGLPILQKKENDRITYLVLVHLVRVYLVYGETSRRQFRSKPIAVSGSGHARKENDHIDIIIYMHESPPYKRPVLR